VGRRPAAQSVADGGDEFEHAQLLADPAERAARNQALRETFAAAPSRHHEAVAHAELDIDCHDSPIVDGDADEQLGPGDRLPDTVAVEPCGAGPDRLHAHAHRPGQTVVLVGGPTAAPESISEILAGARREVVGSPRLDEVVAFSAAAERAAEVGRIEADAAEQLGVRDLTLFVVRPDGYVGLRADHDHVAALARYDALVRDGHA
jgi:hypothetical protein